MNQNNIYKRKAYAEMLEWKRNLADRYALLIEGARRVGKTCLAKQFAEKEYESFIYVDFSGAAVEVDAVKQAFGEAPTIPNLIERLELLYMVKLVPGRSCIVFDEVQRFPVARERIKHFMEYGRYHYIETGSLVGIRENVKDIVIPSEEHGMKLRPLDFEEFLDAMDASMMKEHIRTCFNSRKPLGAGVHEKALDYFRLYMVVGGMPQSVSAYLRAGDDHPLEASEAAKREILRLYDQDIGKYAKGYSSKVRAIFRMIPGALSRHDKKFHLADIDKNARMRRYENAFLWLADSMVANIAYNATEPDVGLEMYLDNSTYKCYSLDTGILLTQAMGGTRKADSRLLRGVRYDNLGINEGMFFENAVAQTLCAKGFDLFFFARRDQKCAENTMEVDFLVRNGIKVCPIEVKSSGYRTHASLDRFVDRYRRHLGPRYVVCSGDYEEREGVVYLPVYMAHCL